MSNGGANWFKIIHLIWLWQNTLEANEILGWMSLMQCTCLFKLKTLHSAVTPKLAGIGLSKMCKVFIIGGSVDQILYLISCLISFISLHICTRRGQDLLNHLCLSVFWKFWKEFRFWKKLTHILSDALPGIWLISWHLDYINPISIGLMVKMVLAARWLDEFPNWGKLAVRVLGLWPIGKIPPIPTVLSSSVSIFVFRCLEQTHSDSWPPSS